MTKLAMCSAIRHLVLLSFLTLMGCATTRPTSAAKAPVPASAVEALDAAFVEAYRQAAADHLQALRRERPIILNDFLSMTLYLPGDRSLRFQMDKRLYFLMARTTHPPLALYAILKSQGFGPLTDSTRKALLNYIELLTHARAELAALPMDGDMRHRSVELLTQSTNYTESVLREGTATPGAFRAYAEAIRPLIEANLDAGAREQLVQFKTQLDQWKAEYPTERWDALLVVVLGFHQARELYATKLLFQWLLREPATERRVVYAEVLIPPFGPRREESQQLALELVAKVDLDRTAADVILGDETALQRDVMGPAAQDVLESWGASPWP